MPLLYVRAIAPYLPGANATDVIINQVHFNRTTLDHFNYTLYTNGTLSNGSDCYLAFHRFQPYMFPSNGSFVNGTSCFSPIHDVGQHAAVGMTFAFMFVISILFSLAGLRKHGRLYLPVDIRWNPIGRRWKWYWLMFLGVCATIGSFMSIDVDRDHVQHSPLVIQSVFYTLMTPFMMAAVWEAVRHWGSWQERQVYNRDQFAFTKKSTRKQQELVLPLIFYVFAFSNLFLAVPRSWDSIGLQRSPQQQELQAKPFATDSRFKAAGFMALTAVMVICYSLEHSMCRYIAKPSGTMQQIMFYVGSAPSQFLVAIALMGVKVGYDIAAAFDFSISPLRHMVNPGWIYGLGYTPVLLIIILFNVCGLCETNEDKALIFQSTELETAFASDVGMGRKKRAKNTWLGRIPHRQPQKQRLSQPSQDDEYYRSVEMNVITSTRAEDKKQPDVDGDQHVQVTTATRADSQSSGTTVNPFLVDSSSSSSSGSAGSTDTMGFVKDVLSSVDGTGQNDRAAQ